MSSNNNSHERTRSHNRHPFQGLYPNQQLHDERQPVGVARADRHLTIDTNLDLGRSRSPRPRPHYKHRHSKSRDGRFPRTMSQIASSAGAKGLLPTWSGGNKEKERDGDDGLLRPITRETTRSRLGSDSTGYLGSGSRSRRGSFLEGVEQNDRIGPTRRQEVRSMEDLEQVKSRRKHGEGYLRSALVSIGSLATDITRRLDYTYYNLLEKITALNTTITSFQGLADSTTEIYDEFDREVASMDQEIRRQVGELQEFQPQLEEIGVLEDRMKRSRQRAEALEGRLEMMRKDIDRWEKRETAWQTRIGRRLRTLWGVVGTAVLAVVVTVVVQNWPVLGSSSEAGAQSATLANGSSRAIPHLSGRNDVPKWSRHSNPHPGPTSQNAGASPTDSDPLRVFDEI